jgi:hypothetical protein
LVPTYLTSQTTSLYDSNMQPSLPHP